MISKSIYERLKKEFGQYSSWAIWKDGDKNDNIDDLSVFDKNVHQVLNPEFVFCALNPGEFCKNSGIPVPDWRGFHVKGCCDYKIRYILRNTIFTGAYMTDVIKTISTISSDQLKRMLRNNEAAIEENIYILCKELKILKSKPILIAFGNDAYNLLCQCSAQMDKTLGCSLKIHKLTHYAHHIKLEDYKEEVSRLASLIQKGRRYL